MTALKLVEATDFDDTQTGEATVVPSKRTFTGTAGLQFKLVVPAQFLLDMRADAAQTEDLYEDVLVDRGFGAADIVQVEKRLVRKAASPFLQAAQAQHPTNDDAFISMILSNGIRNNIRGQLVSLLYQSQIGGTVSPAAIELIATVPDFLNDITIQTIEVPNKETV